MNTTISKSNQLSESLILAVKKGEDTADIIDELAAYDLNQLVSDLSTDNYKKAFWINVYNAFFLILRKERSIEKPAIYRQKLFAIAGQELSLDEVEHGILRRYRYKFSLGYLPNPFARRLIKKLAVKQIDFRIHFALNCGAQSCPPIAFYSAAQIEQQLEMATLSFLEGETTVETEAKEIHISRLFQWYLGDFGGKLGTRKILHQYLEIDSKGFQLVYKPYSWEENLGFFSEETFE